MMHLKRLKETNMNRVLELGKEYGYMLISAYRQLDNPDTATLHDFEMQNKRNNDMSDRLEDDISMLGLSFVPVYGGYHELGHEAEEERSYFVLNLNYKTKEPIASGVFKELAIQLCQEYNQDSVLVYDPEIGKPRYYNQRGKLEMEFSGNLSFNDLQAEYYTSLRKGDKSKGKADRRFTFESYVPFYDTIMGKHSHSSRGEIIMRIKETR